MYVYPGDMETERVNIPTGDLETGKVNMYAGDLETERVSVRKGYIYVYIPQSYRYM